MVRVPGCLTCRERQEKAASKAHAAAEAHWRNLLRSIFTRLHVQGQYADAAATPEIGQVPSPVKQGELPSPLSMLKTGSHGWICHAVWYMLLDICDPKQCLLKWRLLLCSRGHRCNLRAGRGAREAPGKIWCCSSRRNRGSQGGRSSAETAQGDLEGSCGGCQRSCPSGICSCSSCCSQPPKPATLSCKGRGQYRS